MFALLVRILLLPRAFRRGRGWLMLALIVVGLLLLFYKSDSGAATSVVLVFVGIALLIGLAVLSLTIWLEVLPHYKRHTWQTFIDGLKQIFGRGRALPIPSLPSRSPRGVSANALQRIKRDALKMADLPWGKRPNFASVEEAYPLFNRTVGRVRTMTGDLREASEYIQIFMGMPKPLCYIGAAEIMHPLSYLRGDAWGPVGLQQGLRFIAWAQYIDPFQPDALIARAKLLTGCDDERWLGLALDTLEMVQQIAPHHLRLPDAEASLLIRGQQYGPALTRLEAALANPPTTEEIHVALTRRARLLDRMGHYDEALAAYNQINQLSPQDPWTWHNKSLLLMSGGRYAEALFCNQRALSIMDFDAAHQAGARIRARMAEVQQTPQERGWR